MTVTLLLLHAGVLKSMCVLSVFYHFSVLNGARNAHNNKRVLYRGCNNNYMQCCHCNCAAAFCFNIILPKIMSH